MVAPAMVVVANPTAGHGKAGKVVGKVDQLLRTAGIEHEIVLSESAAEYVRVAPWLVIFPGAAISLAVFGTNLLGDALRDILDPRQRD